MTNEGWDLTKKTDKTVVVKPAKYSNNFARSQIDHTVMYKYVKLTDKYLSKIFKTVNCIVINTVLVDPWFFTPDQTGYIGLTYD